MKLSARDLLAVMHCVEHLYAQTDAAKLPMHMLQTVSRILPSKLAALTEVDPVFGQSSASFFPPDAPKPSDILERFQANIKDHPVVQNIERTRDGRPQAISDYLTAKQFHKTGLYRELFGPMGIEDQLSIGIVGSAGLMVGLSFNRARRGFSERDRQILNLLRPHVLRAYLNCRELQQLRNRDGKQRGSLVDQLPLGLLGVDTRGKIVWSTNTAQQMLVAHYPDTADSIHGLPNAVRIWLKTAAAPNNNSGYLIARRPNFEMRIRYCPLKDGIAVLLLQENSLADTPLFLRQYAFTHRETQIMQFILQGYTIAQAAEKFSISPRTVQKHLQHIFRKLDVNSLSAACVKILKLVKK
ncbi:MAG TPA: helix-turn-helix transcriptional regulator [Tepidisphaeraceae bacterium]|jgi:DNA-binding CsgD family transcriptional regulator